MTAMRAAFVLALVVLPTPAPASEASRSDAIVRRFVYEGLALAPVTATAVGYHRHGGALLDVRLDDYSAAGLARAEAFYRDLEQRADAIDQQQLDAERRADLAIVRNNVRLSLLEYRQIQSHRHNPTLYVELIGNALYTPYVLAYAPPATRFGHIIRRLQQVPRLLAQARAQLLDAPEVWNRVAREENSGTIELIDRTLRAAAPRAQRAAYDTAAAPALQALRDFNDWLEQTLAMRTSDWRLGAERYEQKCRYVLATGRSPAELLAAAEADLQAVRAQMAQLAAPRTVDQLLDEIAAQHATPASYMDEARRTLAEATAFVRERGLVTLPPGSNLQVIETPPFMRGVYSVAGFNAAPALEPELGAFYWVTPIPADWPAARVESKLREYNRYGMQHLTIHEAMPGHYVQLEYANRVPDRTRRVLRNIWGNGPYVEGWALYTQQLMTDEGYLGGDVGLRMTLYKQLLRSIANTILDIRLQTLGMSDAQALELMMRDTWQEREEAEGKLQRAKLSSCQLAMYYAGWQGWLDARERYRQQHGESFSLREFHERALRESAVPLPVLETLLE
jgi:uncharacterized protein (DUF885 family)